MGDSSLGERSQGPIRQLSCNDLFDDIDAAALPHKRARNGAVSDSQSTQDLNSMEEIMLNLSENDFREETRPAEETFGLPTAVRERR